jgi:hypothetical protein
MTWIRVEPDEMTTVAASLNRLADELSAVGQEARRDCSSCLPGQAEAVADVALGLVDQILATHAAILRHRAADLLARGTVAAADSLTAASSASGPGISPAPTVGFVGGNPPTVLTIGPSDVLGAAMVGGTSSGWSVDPAAYGFGSVVGGTTTGFVGGGPSNLMGGSFVGGRTWESIQLDAVASAGGRGFLPPTFAQDVANHNITVNLQPSRSSLITDRGYYMSPAEYEQRGYQGLNE